MEEIIKGINGEIQEIIEQKVHVEEQKEDLIKRQEKIISLVEKIKLIQDKNSSEYQTEFSKLKREEQERRGIEEDWKDGKKKLEESIAEKKEHVLKTLEEKRNEQLLKILQEKTKNINLNGNLNVDDVINTNIEELKKEKSKLQVKIKLAQVSDEDLKMVHPDQREDVYGARKHLKDNQNRVKEIDQIMDLYYLVGEENINTILSQFKQLSEQIEEKFDMEHIAKLDMNETKEVAQKSEQKDIVKEEQQEINIKDTMKIKYEKQSKLMEQFSMWSEYYNKTCDLKLVNLNEEARYFVNDIQRILRRKLNRIQDEYYIVENEVDDGKIVPDKRDVKERISNVSKADKAVTSQKLKQKHEENKELYKEDDEKLETFVIQLDVLYEANRSKIEELKGEQNKRRGKAVNVQVDGNNKHNETGIEVPQELLQKYLKQQQQNQQAQKPNLQSQQQNQQIQQPNSQSQQSEKQNQQVTQGQGHQSNTVAQVSENNESPYKVLQSWKEAELQRQQKASQKQQDGNVQQSLQNKQRGKQQVSQENKEVQIQNIKKENVFFQVFKGIFRRIKRVIPIKIRRKEKVIKDVSKKAGEQNLGAKPDVTVDKEIEAIIMGVSDVENTEVEEIITGVSDILKQGKVSASEKFRQQQREAYGLSDREYENIKDLSKKWQQRQRESEKSNKQRYESNPSSHGEAHGGIGE